MGGKLSLTTEYHDFPSARIRRYSYRSRPTRRWSRFVRRCNSGCEEAIYQLTAFLIYGLDVSDTPRDKRSVAILPWPGSLSLADKSGLRDESTLVPVGAVKGHEKCRMQCVWEGYASAVGHGGSCWPAGVSTAGDRIDNI